MTYEEMRQIIKNLEQNISSVMVGKETVTEYILTALIAGGHVLLEDTPGTGKTKLAKTLAASLDADFKRIQFTPDLLPADITGLNIYNRKNEEFEYVEGPVMTNVLLADEINRATPRTQSALLEAMEERQVTIDGKTRKLEDVFIVLATQNPIETSGTFALPEAQMDRFMMQLSLGFPDEEQEIGILKRFAAEDPLMRLEPICTKSDILNMRNLSGNVYIHESLQKYIVQVVHATREHDEIALGVSPRGSLALMKTSQVYAAMQGRDYVIPEDIKKLVIPVLAHRMICYSGTHSGQGIKSLQKILNLIEVPCEEWNTR